MIRDNQKYFNRLHLVIDLLIIELAYMASWYLKFKTPIFEHEAGRLSFGVYMRAMWFILPLYIILYLAFHLYTSKRVQGRRLEFGNILKANILGLMIVLTVLYITKQHNFSREMMFIFFLINILLEVLMRGIIRLTLHMMRKSGFNMKHILLVGYSRAAESYIDRIRAFPQWGYQIKGILDDKVETGTSYNGAEVIGKTDDLLELLAENDLDEIAITLGLNEYNKLEKLVNMCEKSGVHTQFVPDYNNIIPSRPYTEDLMGLPVINIRYVPLSNTFNAMIKRIFDIVCSSLGIIILSPLLLLISLLIKCTSKGPLVFKQERVGLRNEPFMMYKFRSMKVQNESDEKKAWTVKDDPRVTGIGKFIRKTSLDELPQLFNILKGEMSFVGTRPEVTKYVEHYTDEMYATLLLPAGVTSIASVDFKNEEELLHGASDPESKYISEVLPQKMKLNLQYVKSFSIISDVLIIIKTIRTVFIG